MAGFRHGGPVGTLGGSRGGPVDEEQKSLTNSILRCLERLLMTPSGGALDAEALCVTPDEWVWRLEIKIVILDAAGGNLLDASVLSCMAAIRHYRQPHVEDNAGKPSLISADLKEPTPLPLHHTPLSLTFCYLSSEELGSAEQPEPKILADPSHAEELVASVNSSRITIAMNIHGEICFMDFAGGCELQPHHLRTVHQVAAKLVQNDLCSSIEDTLQGADKQAHDQRLRRLQQQRHMSDKPIPDSTDDTIPNVPFYETMGVTPVDLTPNDDTVSKAQREADEAYRLQALDYNVGHIAAKVRDDEPKRPQSGGPNALLELMKKSATKEGDGEELTPMDLDEMDTNTAGETPAPPQQNESQKHADALPDHRSVAQTSKLDSDEEETTVTLQPEFSQPKVAAVEDGDSDDLDLAAAIKKKKKKKKKDKK